MQIIGRRNEQRELARLCESPRPEFVVVYGRRRVGKTFLVREYFNNTFAFQATGIAGGKARVQLRAFNEALKRHGDQGPPAQDWFEAFSRVRDLLERPDVPRDALGGKVVLFIDEMPWLDSPRSDFKAALELFWNGWAASRPDVLLIVCGSATSWIINHLLSDRGGLHNRVTARLALCPFTLGECEEHCRANGLAMNRRQIIESYMVFGGVPYYLDLLDRRLGLVQNIDRLCFAAAGPLRGEFEELYRSLFRRADRHIAVARALAGRARGLTRGEIEQETGIAGGGTLSATLEELEACGFLRRYRDFTRAGKDGVFQLVDPFTLFALRFVEKTTDERFWSNNCRSPAIRAWSGYAFELVCLLHIRQMLAALGIAGIASDVRAWRSRAGKAGKSGKSGAAGKGAQIDLLIDRSDGIVNVCEMKYTEGEYVIDRAEDQALRDKLAVFAAETGTAKALHLTLVSVDGAARNMYRGTVQSEITADDLFAP